MEPIRYEEDCAVFTIEQINLFGEPCYHGFVNYIVLSSLDYESPITADFKFSEDRERLRPVHRYSRVKRFEWILYQLIGYRGDVPVEVVDLCRDGFDPRPGYIWNSIRKILKENKMRVYYNRIGNIIYRLTKMKIRFGDSYLFLEGVVDDFRCLKFVRGKGGRTYFPDIRFVALKMLIKHGAKFDYDIPLLQTKRKLSGLETLFTELSEKKNECKRID